MVQKNKKMLSRLPKTKIVKIIMKKGNKFCVEKLLKKSFKILIKNNNKELRKIIYLSLNHSLPIFKLENQKVFNKKRKLTKLNPSFFNSNSFRVFSALKIIIKNSKLKKKCFIENLQEEFISILSLNATNNTTKLKILNQEQVLINQVSLIFYRWYN